MEKVATAVRRKVQHESELPTVELKITHADVLEYKPPGGVDLIPPLRAAWGWLLASISGTPYRKLLTRAILADSEYKALVRRLGQSGNQYDCKIVSDY